MDPEKWTWSCRLFERALELDAAHRVDFLERASGRDPEVLHLVLRMLEADDVRPNALDRLGEGLGPEGLLSRRP